MFPNRRVISLLAWALAACGGSAPVVMRPENPSDKPSEETKPSVSGPVDGIACVGTFDSRHEGMKEVTDDALATSAIDATGKGKLCMARVFEATMPIKVYRVWNSSKTYTEFGKWWSFDKPVGPVDAYRKQNAICPEWNNLDRLTVCEIKPGARFAVGPGQSAKCAEQTYEKSPSKQVFIPNDTRENKVFVEHCEQLGAWP